MEPDKPDTEQAHINVAEAREAWDKVGRDPTRWVVVVLVFALTACFVAIGVMGLVLTQQNHQSNNLQGQLTCRAELSKNVNTKQAEAISEKIKLDSSTALALYYSSVGDKEKYTAEVSHYLDSVGRLKVVDSELEAAISQYNTEFEGCTNG